MKHLKPWEGYAMMALNAVCGAWGGWGNFSEKELVSSVETPLRKNLYPGTNAYLHLSHKKPTVDITQVTLP